jgi:hypothetical protein
LNKKKQKKAKKQNLKANGPSQERLNNLLEHYQSGRLGDAENVALSITQDFPKDQLAWRVLGIIFGQTGRKSEGVEETDIRYLKSNRERPKAGYS